MAWRDEVTDICREMGWIASDAIEMMERGAKIYRETEQQVWDSLKADTDRLRREKRNNPSKYFPPPWERR